MMAAKKRLNFTCIIGGFKHRNLNSTQCFLANFSLLFHDISFGFICIGILTPIILISIFGGIKEHYCWFILNQALWDLLITVVYARDHEIWNYFVRRWIEETAYDISQYYLLAFGIILDTSPYTSLLLLSFTRFLCLYFPKFYQKLTSKLRIFWLIVAYNLLIIFIHIDVGFKHLISNHGDNLFEICSGCHENYTTSVWAKCNDEIDKDWIYQSLMKLEGFFKVIVYVKPLLCLSFSIIAAVMIIIQILKRASFQLQNQRRDFFISLRILVVILLQSFINFGLFSLEVVRNIEVLMEVIFNIEIKRRGSPFSSCQELEEIRRSSTTCMEMEFPVWMERDFGLTDPLIFPAIRQLRIFIESIVILTIMTGYRETVVDSIRFILKFFKNPRKSFAKCLYVFEKHQIKPY